MIVEVLRANRADLTAQVNESIFLNTFFKDDFWQCSAAGLKFKVTPVNHPDRWLMVNMQTAAENMSV